MRGNAPAGPRSVGLFTTLPILWGESAALGDLLANDAPPHWARAAIEARGKLVPLDTLAGKSGKLPLGHDAVLVMAQPRALSPDENVALDQWVRAGGGVLLFADPMLTEHSAYALGDKRRPQDVALLSPILGRWGLTLEFDEDQPAAERRVPLLGGEMPVNLSGRLVVDAEGICKAMAEGLAALCRIGAGRVLVVADAALLESGKTGDGPDRAAMLERLLAVISR